MIAEVLLQENLRIPSLKRFLLPKTDGGTQSHGGSDLSYRVLTNCRHSTPQKEGGDSTESSLPERSLQVAPAFHVTQGLLHGTPGGAELQHGKVLAEAANGFRCFLAFPHTFSGKDAEVSNTLRVVSYL